MVGYGVNPFSQTAHDGNLALRQVGYHLFGYLFAVNHGPPGTDDGQAPFILRQQGPADIKHRRIIVYFLKSGRVALVLTGKHVNTGALQLFHLRLRRDGGPPLVNGAQAGAVQSGVLQFGGGCLPGVCQVAEVVLQLRQPDPPDAGYIVEPYPVFNFLVQSNFILA